MIEKRTSDTILQKDITVTLGGKSYHVPAPNLATIIELSEAVALFPADAVQSDNIVRIVLRDARKYRSLGRIMALMIVGAKKRGLLRRLAYIERCRHIRRVVMEQATPHELIEAAMKVLANQQLHDFFALTAFLSGVNITKETKAETTVSGQQSEASSSGTE